MPERSTRFSLTADDFLSAQKLHIRRHFLKLPMLFVYAVCLIFLAVGLFFPPASSGLRILVLGFPLAMGGFILFNHFVMLPYRTRKIFSQQKTLHEPVDAQWDEEGYAAASGNVSGLIKWTQYHRLDFNELIILLYQSDTLFQMLPRRALTQNQFDDFIALAKTAGLKITT